MTETICSELLAAALCVGRQRDNDIEAIKNSNARTPLLSSVVDKRAFCTDVS